MDKIDNVQLQRTNYVTDKGSIPLSKIFIDRSCLIASMGALGILTMATACFNIQAQSSIDVELTVSSILADPTDGLPVTLRGWILDLGNDEGEYVFTDGTGEITLEIYDEDFRNQPDILIEISGEVNLESEDPSQYEAHPEAVEIDVYHLLEGIQP